MKKLLALLDGYKRIIVLALALAQLWALQVFHVDVSGYLGVLYAVLGWNPDQLLPVPVTLLATTVAGALAIFDGVRKALRERRSAP